MAVILADDIFKRIFLNENIRISIKISLQFVSKGLIENKPALHGSGNGLEPNRRQDITCSNEDPVYPRIYAALGGDELKVMVKKKNMTTMNTKLLELSINLEPTVFLKKKQQHSN